MTQAGFKKITRRDVAREAGVTETIVSYVLNNNRYVNTDKRKRVLAAVEKLGYKPNTAARALKGKSLNHIVFIADQIVTEHFSLLLSEMDKRAYDLGYMISLCQNRNTEDFVNSIISRQFDGVIISSISFSKGYIRQLIKAGIPVVLIENRDYSDVENAGKINNGLYEGARSFEAILETLPQIETTLDQVFSEPYDSLIFTGCGTSFYLAQTASYLWRALNDTPAIAVPCSELLFFPENYIKGNQTLVLPITRKSCTTEVRQAMDRVHEIPGVSSLAITCDADSSHYNENYILAPETAEDSVIMTRSFTSMIFLAEILSMHVSGHEEMINAMRDYPVEAEKLLKECDGLAEKILREHPEADLFVTLGQGAYYGVSNECMNKMKEMGIANSEAYYSMEYRHGPMSLVDENTFLLLLSNEKTRKTDEDLMEQMRSFGGVTCGLGPDTDQMRGLDYALKTPEAYSELQAAALMGLIGQFLGYYISLRKDIDADSPRHLSQAIVLK